MGNFWLEVGGTAEYARLLYRSFHDFDGLGAQVIVAQAVAEEGLGRALMNRLRKASAGKVLG